MSFDSFVQSQMRDLVTPPSRLTARSPTADFKRAGAFMSVGAELLQRDLSDAGLLSKNAHATLEPIRRIGRDTADTPPSVGDSHLKQVLADEFHAFKSLRAKYAAQLVTELERRYKNRLDVVRQRHGLSIKKKSPR